MPSIVLDEVSVRFPVYGTNSQSFKRALVRLSTGGFLNKDEGKILTVEAIDKLSFEVKNGSRLGLIGHNGAGKSTLLRLLSGIYEPTSGKAIVKGRITSLIDIMCGMDEELTGYENITLRGILSGFSYKGIKQIESVIADFTGLGDYLQVPLRTYSSGMRIRLALGIALNVEAEVLLIDEVVGAGDAAFAKKSTEKILSLISNSSIVVLSSHDMEMVRSICDTVLVMEAGKKIFHGGIEEGIEHYKKSSNS